MKSVLKRYWLTLGLLITVVLILVDSTGTLAGVGRRLMAEHGAEVVIFLIFLLSGMNLETEQMKQSLVDLPPLMASFLVIFAVSPAIALLLGQLPMAEGVRIGLYLVALMPSTLSSGVVMTASAGGNMAAALLITMVANSLATFSIPLIFPFMFGSAGIKGSLDLNRLALMVRIASLVLFPLVCGLLLRLPLKRLVRRFGAVFSIVNQALVLVIVGMATARSKPTIMASLGSLPVVGTLAFVYHGLLLVFCLGLTRLARIGPGRREAVIFMGGQKTLALAILIQMRFFPQFGEALVFNVGHHLIHLMMDGFMVAYLAATGQPRATSGPDASAGPSL